MEGNVPFQDALAARLNIIKPSQQSVARFLQERPFQLSDGIEAVVDLLHQHQKPVYLISGGFRQMIEPVAARLGIPQHRIFANRLLFDASGDFAGFDPDELTCRDGGKAKVAQHLISAHGFSPLVVVGDGATDLQARPPANVFIGYGGVVTREKVAQEADWFIRDFQVGGAICPLGEREREREREGRKGGVVGCNSAVANVPSFFAFPQTLLRALHH